MSESVTREEYQEEKKEVGNAIVRIHTRVDLVENTTTAIKISAENIEKCVCRIEKIMYGDQNADGVLTKVSNLGQKVTEQDKKIGGVYWFGSIVIIALVTSLVGAIIGLVFKK